MHNAKVNGLSIGYTQQTKSGDSTITENINIASKTSEQKGETDIVITTESWTFNANEVDQFCKELKKFVEQATGKKKKQVDTPENVTTGHRV